jgi:transcriptional regulator with PAS, ATPase and Fis domain
MAGAWMLLANASRPATLIESSTGTVNKVAIPFEITATYLRSMDESIERINSSVAAKFKEIIYKSDVMIKSVAEATRIAQHDIPVLIYGESGTGKELFARAIHDASSRADKPYIPVNCGAITESLIESELFGHKKGSFTGAHKDHIGKFMAANGGTLFLDEIGDLPLQAQVKLLRVIDTQKITMVGDTEEKPITVRIIAATHRNLQTDVMEGRFRLDLFYRLAVGFVEIPPLRDRQGDVELLVNEFVKQSNQKLNVSIKAMKELRSHSWPGNVRELKNTISRCCYKSNGNIIHEDVVRDAFIQIGASATSDILGREFNDDFKIEELTDEVVRHYYVKAMKKSGGNKANAAKMLGLEAATFCQHLRKNPHLLTGLL